MRTFDEKEKYSNFLLEKSKDYTIEENVQMHLYLLGIEQEEEY